MKTPLIITERGWLPRLVDILLTVIGWCGFVWLFVHGLLALVKAAPWSGPRPLTSELNTLTLYAAIGVFNALVLIGWAKYNQLRFRVERRSRRPGLRPLEVAQSFAITPSEVATLSSHDVLRVHHNEQGHITDVEALRAQG